jgi:glyoxylase-like metal-dependent hydrolase (beta-lactamase superfamily II)
MQNSVFEAAGLQVFERGWLSCNNILFDGHGARESVLIDSGYASHAVQTLALVRRALGSRALSRIVNTHLHSDHCGGNHALQLAFDCDVDVPAGEAEKVDRWDESLLTYLATGQTCPRFNRTGTVRGGDEIELGPFAWQVIAAPGHDPESMVLYQAELQLLISADALWENGFGVVFPELDGVDAFNDVRDTLDRLANLSVNWIIPGHGAPFQGLDAAIARANSRLDSFIADPARHARHAAKVLIKFHLLEVQRERTPELLRWLETTRYMRLTHARHFETVSFRNWCELLLGELKLSRSIAIDDDIVRNL